MKLSEVRAGVAERPALPYRPDIPEVLIAGLTVAAIGWAVYNWVQRRAAGKRRSR